MQGMVDMSVLSVVSMIDCLNLNLIESGFKALSWCLGVNGQIY